MVFVVKMQRHEIWRGGHFAEKKQSRRHRITPNGDAFQRDEVAETWPGEPGGMHSRAEVGRVIGDTFQRVLLIA